MSTDTSELEDREDLQRVQDRIAAANDDLADAITRSARLSTTPHPLMDLRNTHDALRQAYAETRSAIDRLEHTIDDRSDGPNPRGPTPRQIKSEHADRFEELYDGPVWYVACQLLERNRREWLHVKPDTLGAEQIERHGLTENQRHWLTELQAAWAAYDGGDETDG